MKLQFLGTAAAEGIPALFCDCETCHKARGWGGKNLRTRSQALIDGKLLLDFGPDLLMHTFAGGIDLNHISACLVTHAHEDHWYPDNLHFLRRGFSHPKEGFVFTVYGSEDLRGEMESIAASCNGLLRYAPVRPYEPFAVEGYTVTALPAYHGTEHPYFYLITDGKSTVLYAHDTDYFYDEVWEYLARTKPHLDLISLDCTEGAAQDIPYHAHMCLGRDVLCRDRLREMGLIDSDTRCVLNHFSHNGISAAYDEFAPIAAAEGFETSYDGMTVLL